MAILRKTLAVALLASLSVPALSACVGTDSYRTCYDDNGNTYNTTRSGGYSQTSGYNSNTGSSWEQSSISTGGITQTYGTAADGGSWDSTTIRNGDLTTTYGTDSNGDSFSKTCYDGVCY